MAIAAILKRYALAALMLLGWCWLSQPVLASTYGQGGYGSCSYQQCPTSTQTTLPSGLKISVNLTEGQVIPQNGYTIIVTPLNGQGTSFQKVDFYIDSVLAQTVQPDETGTARWFWNPLVVPGTDVKVIVTGTDNSTATEEFHVTIGTTPTPITTTTTPTPTTPTPSKPANNPIAAIGHAFQAVYSGAKRVIRALPKPVVYGFPYILFVLLGVNVLLLILQAKRELREYRTLQGVLVRERTVADSKKTLLELIAHYFRTPLTILLGGIDMLDAKNPGVNTKLKAVSEHLRAGVEQLLNQARLRQEEVVVGNGTSPASRPIWQQPGLFLPLLLIAAIVVPFNYVAGHAGTLNVTQVNLGVQFVLFVLLAVVTYQVFRRLQLRKRDAQELQQVAQAEQATSNARDDLIASAASSFQADVTALDNLVKQLPASQASQFISDGQTRFHDLLTKLAVASSLHGTQNSEASVPTKLSVLLASAMESLAVAATKRGITTHLQSDVDFTVGSAELFSFVLRSILDNAIVYSPDKGVIQISGSATPQQVVITISDSGSGIAPDKLSLLFQPFSKIEGAEVFTHEGMGFSLYLDKLIMNYLGGGIALDSKPGRGTVVTLSLPPSAPSAPPA